MVMTASTLYEAVEPHLLWTQLFSILLSNVTSENNGQEVCLLPNTISIMEMSSNLSWY